MECWCFFLLFFGRLLNPTLAQSSLSPFSSTTLSPSSVGDSTMATPVPSINETSTSTAVPSTGISTTDSLVSCSSCLSVELSSTTMSATVAVSPTADPASGLTTDQIIGIAVGVGATVILMTLMAIILTFLVIKSNTHESRVVPLNKKRGPRSPELQTVTHGKTVQMSSLPPAE